MAVEWQLSDAYVIAVNPWVDEYGHGDSEQEAREDLLMSLAEFRESLERQEVLGGLSDELIEILTKLRGLLAQSPD